MNQKYSTKGIALLGLLSAATFVVGRFLQIPIPAINGYVTLLDAGIFTVALAFGKREGAIVGGLAAFLSDLTSGFPQWMFFSLIIHGGQGYLGALTKRKWINFILSGLFMVGGYFFCHLVTLWLCGRSKPIDQYSQHYSNDNWLPFWYNFR